MIRRLNYTNRLKIDLDRISIAKREDSANTFFQARFSFDGLELPAEARVFVEAHRRTTIMRFDFGRVSGIQQPENTNLGEFAKDEAIVFRVKIVQDEAGKILALARNIPCLSEDESAKKRIPILPVEPDDLGDEIWKLDFEEQKPILLVNKTITSPRDVMHIARKDADFKALVYPAVVRSVLSKICIDDGCDDPNEDDSNWLRFATRVLGVSDPPEFDGKEEDHPQTIQWIDEAVDVFSKRMQLRNLYTEHKQASFESI